MDDSSSPRPLSFVGRMCPEDWQKVEAMLRRSSRRPEEKSVRYAPVCKVRSIQGDPENCMNCRSATRISGAIARSRERLPVAPGDCIEQATELKHGQ